ncbi:MAG: type IV toxin-antitoxin system AbiEi family antitoxin domain-containing protein [Bacillota bacterium]
MIKTIDALLDTYEDYGDPYGKINREVKNKNLFPVVKGLYETDASTPGVYLTSYIYGPSYVSFEYALYYHGLIPEKVTVFTSATFGKRKSKRYKNRFGIFTYRDIPKTAFPFGIKAYVENGYSYIIASPEKALCDTLYIASPQTSMKKLKDLIFENLRIDEESFYELDFERLLLLCDKYPSTNLKLLKRIIVRESKNYDHSRSDD